MNKYKKYIKILIAVGVLFFAAAVYLMLSGPRMEYQYKVKTYEALCFPPPPGTYTVEIPPQMPDDNFTNPVPVMQSNIEKGKIYYSYYCLFCHGETGKGDGEVGQSYYPKPSNLNVGRITKYTDAQVYRTMLTGIGHAPVLERVVLPRYRWYIVTYVRSLQK